MENKQKFVLLYNNPETNQGHQVLLDKTEMRMVIELVENLHGGAIKVSDQPLCTLEFINKQTETSGTGQVVK